MITPMNGCPDSLRWYINGKLVREVLRQPGKPFPTHNSKTIMMIWNSSKLSEWMGPFGNPPLPISAYYDWVAFTKAGDKCQICRNRSSAKTRNSALYGVPAPTRYRI